MSSEVSSEVSSAVLDHFREQAHFCDQYGSPFMARLIEQLARDVEAGGPTAQLVAGWPRSPRADALSLRISGALHAAVLSGRDPELAAEYPAAQPAWDIARVWPRAQRLLARERDWIAGFLGSAPQTNETRRTIALLAGFLWLAARHDRELELYEIGASAGLNLYWDRYAYRTAHWQWGDGPVQISTEWAGAPPPVDAVPRIRSRAACDLNPIDIRDPGERLRLRAYIWADQAERLARFDAAAAVAAAHGMQVERADAAEWLEARLPRRSPDALTVVYHSVFYQYPRTETRQRIAAAIAQAGEQSPAPLAWLRLEPEAVLGGPRDSTRFLVDVIRWPGAERHTLAATDGHANFVHALV
ncbi:MAG TPA: DUF2332 family protein [Kofleriaceae bacterium]|jgi:hypothetical protein|nr:DUF2332 family protein [Kofleriaceae bacterium]